MEIYFIFWFGEKVRETSGNHQGHIKWIKKFDFGNLPVEDRRTNKRWRKIFTESPTETFSTRYGSASAWIFFTETIFFTNFKWSQDIRRVERFSSSLLPLFIGKWGRSLPPSSPRRARLLPPEATAFWRPKWAWLLFAPSCLLNTPLQYFADSFSVTLWKFTNSVTILVFLP